VADAGGESPLVLVHADPEAYLVPEAAMRLVAALDARPELDLVAPGTNEPWCEAARIAPPFAYATPTLLVEVDPRQGLRDSHVEDLLRFARGL